MHCYLTAEDWARFSHRFTEADLRELKLAEKHYRDQAQTPSLLRSHDILSYLNFKKINPKLKWWDNFRIGRVYCF